MENPEPGARLATRLQEPAQAHGGPQFERSGFLPGREFQRLSEIRFGFVLRATTVDLEKEGAVKPIKLRFVKVCSALAHNAERFRDLCQRERSLAVCGVELR